jgi:hypothetical protein
VNRSTAFVCVCVMLGGAVSAGSSAAAQSLADVARKEEARRKTVADPAKVYTNKDLKPVPAPASPPAAATAQKADEKPASEKSEKDAAKPGEAAKEPVKDQAYWAARLKALKEQLARDETYVEALQSRVNGLLADFVNRDDPAQKNIIERDRLKAIAEMERLKQAIPNDKKAIDNLLEEARRAGVPPGWLR